ncbi:ABC transporter ATP-binding protein [[Clostridium] innocuum]|nr:ABC transporter ATP-binding protein [[Clostridium] innocuum]
MKSIEAFDITKTYNGRVVVDNLSFTVEQGEVFGLLGHNGAGKSTTIDCILGLTKPDHGSARILGQDAAKNRKTLFEHVGVQLQHEAHANNIRVSEVCEETAALYHDPADYHALLKQFQLEAYVNQKVEQLSGGERQKLSVVVALIPKPKVIFLDELTTGLDVAARREVWHILKALKQKGMTIFLTTHYMEEAENLCDRVLILKAGRRLCEGSVAEIIESSPCKNLEDAYLWYSREETNI